MSSNGTSPSIEELLAPLRERISELDSQEEVLRAQIKDIRAEKKLIQEGLKSKSKSNRGRKKKQAVVEQPASESAAEATSVTEETFPEVSFAAE